MQKQYFYKWLLSVFLIAVFTVAIPLKSYAQTGNNYNRINDFELSGDSKQLIKYHGQARHVVTPRGISRIEKFAFYGSKTLQSVTISQGVTTISKSAFSNCKNLKTVIFPSTGLYTIGRFSFHKCKSLSNITIPQGVTAIGRHAFAECISLKNITIPDSVKSIGSGAFLTIPSVTLQGRNKVFRLGEAGELIDQINGNIRYCPPSLPADYVIPGDIKTIGEYSFAGCKNLISITIPDNVTNIGKHAFHKCTNLRRASIPRNIKLGNDAFPKECRIEYRSAKTSQTPVSRKTETQDSVSIDKEFKLSDDRKTLLKYNGDADNVVIPDGVSVIKARAFNWRKHLVSVKIPRSVTTIESNAFAGCTEIKKIFIHENITYIGDGAFAGVKSVQVAPQNRHFKIGRSGELLDIQKNKILFLPSSCQGKYTIPYGTTAIGDFAFYVCEELTGITIPDSVKSIGNFAFASCRKMTAIEIPESVSAIGINAFAACFKLVKIKLPNNMTMIPNGLFYNCQTLSQLTIPESVTYIGSNAFFQCRGLKELTIPKNVKKIGKTAFHGVNAVKVSPDNINFMIDEQGALLDLGKNSLLFLRRNFNGEYTIPHGIDSIEEYAFSRCLKLTGVNIPDSVTRIAPFAFYACRGLKKVNIPHSVKTVSFRAFAQCPGLSNVTLPKECKIGKEAFDKNCKITLK